MPSDNPRARCDLDEIEAVAKQATTGPYFSDSAISGDGSVVMSEATGFRVAHLPETDRVTNHEADSSYFAALPPEVTLELVRRLREAEAIVRDLAASEPFERDRDGEWSCVLCASNGTDLKIIKNGEISDAHWAECPYRRAVEAARRED